MIPIEYGLEGLKICAAMLVLTVAIHFVLVLVERETVAWLDRRYRRQQ